MSLLAEGAPPAERVWVTFSRRFDELGEVMKFRLTYDGELFTSGAEHKHEIRRKFHRQLKLFWLEHPMLKHWFEPGSQEGFDNNPNSKTVSHVDFLGDNFKLANFRFVPLATQAWDCVVSLDILFLRNGRPGRLWSGAADIDGRLKTLLDALQRPTQVSELGNNYRAATPPPEEDPFFVLMENDGLVGNVSVTTDILLEPTCGMGAWDKNDSRVVITADVRGYSGFAWGTPFL